MSSERHIIRKLFIELELPTQAGAIALQQKVSHLYQEEVVKHLERVFDDLNLNGQILRIPKLEIDLGTIAPDQIEGEFVEKCVVAIQQAVSEEAISFKSESSSNRVNQIADVLNCFTHFLATGTLPWHVPFKSIEDLEEHLQMIMEQQSGQLIEILKVSYDNRTQVLNRLVSQFSDAFLDILLESIFGMRAIDLRDIQSAYLSHFQTLSSSQARSSFYQKLFEGLLSTLLGGRKVSINLVEARQEVETRLNKLLSDAETTIFVQLISEGDIFTTTDLVESFLEKMEKSSSPELRLVDYPTKNTELENIMDSLPSFPTEALFVDNAGLVICAYYLPLFFKGLGLLEEGQFKSSVDEQRAVHLTQFLVTGETHPAEFELMLNKVLCGIPLNAPIERFIELTREEQDEAENLLEYIIKYWTILGNTSPEALRSTFLQRRGKLSYEKSRSGWLLQVEKQGYDICIERLPWTISVIKLPWMPEPLQVEWV